MAVQNAQNSRAMAEVWQDIVGNIQEIIRSEFRLGKAEISEETAKAAHSSVPLAVGVVLALYAFGFILLAIVYALSAVVNAWLASLIVGVAALVVSVIMV